MLRMEEYYKILHFLKSENIDRIYPVEEYFLDKDNNPVVYDGDSFLFKTNREQFNGLDYVEVLLESSVECNRSELKFNISKHVQGYDPIMVLEAEEGDVISPNVPVHVVFKIRKKKTMSEASRNLTNVRSIELVTPNNSDFKVHDICFRDNNALFNLEQLNYFYEDAKYYILAKLHMNIVPDELTNHVYTAAAGYAWMSVWEYEARVMNDEQKNAKSYGKWLFAQVDEAIDLYKVSHGIADDDELFVQTGLVTCKPLEW